MKRILGVVSLACLVAVASVVVLAQGPSEATTEAAVVATGGVDNATMQAPGTISRIYMIKVKPGMEAQWMEGAKQHVAWHRAQNDSFTWIGFYVETGKDTGKYGWITQGHDWADFDAYDAAMGAADGENAMATMGQYEESHTSVFTMGFPDISNPPDPGTQFPLVSVEHYYVMPAKRADFMGAVTKAHEALQAGGFEEHYSWSTTINGGDSSVMTLTFPMMSWADMEEPDPGIEQIFADQLGAEGAAALMESFFASIVKSESWIARIIPDLTYVPGS